MLDVIIAKVGEEDQFIAKAKEFGYSSLFIIYEEVSKLSDDYLQTISSSSSVSISFGVFSGTKHKLKLISQEIALGTSKLNSSKKVTYVYDLEYVFEKDHLHQRKSGANEVLLKQLKENKIGVLVSLSHLRTLDDQKQSFILGHIAQNGVLARKISLSFHLVSFATFPESMRHSKDVLSLAKTLGFHF